MTGKVTILPPAGKIVSGAGKVFSAADALDAVRTIATAVTEHRRLSEEHQTARQAIRERASVQRTLIEENRKALDSYVDGAFAERKAQLARLMDNLDRAVEANNVEMARALTDAFADVLRTAPPIPAADLRQDVPPAEPVFQIGKPR